ncbi:MAG: hypothetical protein RL150_420 [Candidatus Parcubacteria bacterium]
MHTLDVPYCSQFDHVCEAAWQPRACGVACVKMVLDYLRPEHGCTVDELIEEAVIMNGYTKDGWAHDALVNLFHNHGVHAYREEFRSMHLDTVTKRMRPSAYEPQLVRNGISKIANVLHKGKPVIVSMGPGFRTPTSSHLVVLTGFAEDDTGLEGFYYNDPDSRTGLQKSIFVDLATFRQYWRKRAIFAV